MNLWHLRDHIRRCRSQLPRWAALWAALPAAFQEAVRLPAFRSGWFLWEGAAGSRAFHLQGGEVICHEVSATGRLGEGVSQPSTAGLPEAAWQPALVLDWDESRSFRAGATYGDPRGVPFLFGCLSSLSLIAAEWGTSTFPAHCLVAKVSTQRQLLLASHRDPSLRLRPGQALMPVIWSASSGEPLAGVRALEAHWALQGEPSQGSQDVQYLPQLYFSSQPRAAPRDRSAPQAQVRPRQAHVPRDEVDPVEPPSRSALSSASSRAWKELSEPDIGRPARLTAWRLMHGSLMVGAFRQHVHRGELPALEACCPHSCCEDQVATLSHTFLQCPLVAPVISYLQALWKLIDPVAPPLLPAVLLTGDVRSWAPSPGLQTLWVRLRVYFLQAVWSAVHRARGVGGVGGSAGVVSSLIHACHVNMRQDWLLATSGFKAEDADCPTQQLRGLCPRLSKEHFFRKWGGQGRLCTATSEGKLVLLWTINSPVSALPFCNSQITNS